MTSIILSTLAFFAASFFFKRRLEAMDIPPGMTRKILIFSLALAVSYGVALVVDHLFPGSPIINKPAGTAPEPKVEE
jgi:hypothetical protein